MSVRIISGDCRTILPTLPSASVQCCVTSPPYFGLRDYGVAGQLGLEATPDAYIAEMVAVFREVKRVLRDDGVIFLNLGDSFSDKQLLMMPARVALALQEDGWWLRSSIIWHKPNPMPESVTDRPTSAHEHVFLLTKRATYFYDADAVAEPVSDTHGAQAWRRLFDPSKQGKEASLKDAGIKGGNDGERDPNATHRNLRNVWTIASQPFPGSHFATMPPDLAERCIRAGSAPGDTVLDPFSGAGTTALVADRLQRHAIGIELNPSYAGMACERVRADAGLFAEVAA